MNHAARPHQYQRPVYEWWHRTGEPLSLSILVGATATLVLLVMLDLIAWHVGVQAMLAVAWLVGVLMLPRLLALLRHERTRLLVGGAVIVAALLFAVKGNAAELSLLPAPALAPELAGIALLQDESVSFVAAPRISKTAFVRLLQRGNGGGPSPAAPNGEELYDIIVSYGIDPAVALAFFAHESQMGTTGVTSSQDLHNWGGQRGAYNGQRVAGRIMVNGKPFVRFASWQDGVRDWCELILYRYVRRGLDTVAEAVPVYAPSSDNNVPEAYINTIHRMVAVWQGRTPPPPANLPHIYSDLPVALLTETFLAAGVDYHPDWAFHRYAMDEAKAGRPLGSPLGESRRITVGSNQFVVQAFALDTLYTPLAAVESQTNWSDVRRLSTMLGGQNPLTQPQAPPEPAATAVPAPAQQSPFQPK